MGLIHGAKIGRAATTYVKNMQTACDISQNIN